MRFEKRKYGDAIEYEETCEKCDGQGFFTRVVTSNGSDFLIQVPDPIPLSKLQQTLADVIVSAGAIRRGFEESARADERWERPLPPDSEVLDLGSYRVKGSESEDDEVPPLPEWEVEDDPSPEEIAEGLEGVFAAMPPGVDPSVVWPGGYLMDVEE